MTKSILLDKATLEPCPTGTGGLMCTNPDPNHLHIFSHMAPEAVEPPSDGLIDRASDEQIELTKSLGEYSGTNVQEAVSAVLSELHRHRQAIASGRAEKHKHGNGPCPTCGFELRMRTRPPLIIAEEDL